MKKKGKSKSVMSSSNALFARWCYMSLIRLSTECTIVTSSMLFATKTRAVMIIGLEESQGYLLTFLRARSHSEGSCPSNTCLSHMPVTRDARVRLSKDNVA